MTQPNTPDNDYAMSDDDLIDVVDTPVASVPESTEEVETPEEEVAPELPEATPTEESVEGEGTAEPEAEEEKADIDYHGFYEGVTKTFRANGKDLQVSNPDDIIALMQQGANYSKKMAAIKPMLKIGKMLEENELLDENQLSYLIDLKNMKPEAIAKLVKDSGIDLYEFDTSVGESYVAPNRSVSDVSLELSTVLEDLEQNSPTYQRTITIIGKEWDADSRKVMAEHPQLLNIIDSQVQDGTYDKIVEVIESERLYGRLKGLSDIEAYRTVGTRLQAEQEARYAAKDTPLNITPATPQPKARDNSQRKAAAASPRKAPVEAVAEFNPLTLSDEEVLKLTAQTQFH